MNGLMPRSAHTVMMKYRDIASTIQHRQNKLSRNFYFDWLFK